jgi:hypothetical protein
MNRKKEGNKKGIKDFFRDGIKNQEYKNPVKGIH